MTNKGDDKLDAQLDYLIMETSEDAVFSMLTAVSVFCIETRADALAVLDQDPDCVTWLETTVRLIPKAWKSET